MIKTLLFSKVKLKLIKHEKLDAAWAGILADLITYDFDERLMPAVLDWLESDHPQAVAIDKADTAYIMQIEQCSFIEALCICNARFKSLERYGNLTFTRKRDAISRENKR